MKKMNRKGFTIVELVIVIAVIAILAGVLIPTFSGLVQKAQDSAAIQEARNKYTEYVGAHDYSDGTSPAQNIVIEVDDQYVIVKDAKLVDKVYDNKDVAKNDAKHTNGTAAAFLCDEHVNNVPADEADENADNTKCSDCGACLKHFDATTPADHKCDHCGECMHEWEDKGTTRTCKNCKANCIIHDWNAETGKCTVCEEECPTAHVTGTNACPTCGKANSAE